MQPLTIKAAQTSKTFTEAVQRRQAIAIAMLKPPSDEIPSATAKRPCAASFLFFTLPLQLF